MTSLKGIPAIGGSLERFFRRLIGKDHIRSLRARGLVVGKNFWAEGGVVIDSSHCWHIQIGDDVTLAPRVHILAHDASTKRHLGYTRVGKVVIGNRVFIGAGAIILPGVTIGDHAIIGAGSVVTKCIPEGVVAAGNPARVICSTDEFLARRQEEMASYPRFGTEYQFENSPSEDMKAEMNARMKNGFGYVI